MLGLKKTFPTFAGAPTLPSTDALSRLLLRQIPCPLDRGPLGSLLA